MGQTLERLTSAARAAFPDHEIKFLRDHDACKAALDWLAAGQFPSLEAAWQVCQRGDWMLWLLYETNALDDATWRHLAVDFAEQVRHLMADERSVNALDVARRYADGQATREELAAARAAARAAAGAAAWAAARAAAWAAAWDAARAAAWDAARAAAWAAAGAAAGAKQADLIRARVPHAPTIAANIHAAAGSRSNPTPT